MSMNSSLDHAASTAASGAPDGKTNAAFENDPELTISQMSRLYSVSLRTLRFYEDRGLIKPRREGNARFYRGADRVRLEMILRGKKLGFTLTEIMDLIGGKGPRKRLIWRSSCSRSRSSTRSAISNASAAKSTTRSSDCAPLTTGFRKPQPERAVPGERRLVLPLS